MTRPRPLVPRLGATLALTALAAVALPAAASAKPTGATKIELKGAAATALAAQDVRISAQKPAQANARRIVLPVVGGTVASGATLRNGGSVSFRTRVDRRTRTVKLTGWQTKIGSGGSKVSAKLGGRRLTIFTIATPKRRVALDRSSKTARLNGGSVRLTPAGAKALRTGLALRALTAGPLGSATVAAKLDGGTSGGGTDTGRTPTPGGGGGTTTPGGGGTTPTPSPGDPRATPITDEPPVLAVPPTAVPIVSATITWWVRDSFIRYIETGEGTTVSAGAIKGSPVEGPDHVCSDVPANPGPLVYSFTFPFRSGWVDAASGAAAIYGSGAVRFGYRSHTIDMIVRDPELELVPGAARAISRLDGSGGTALGNKRAVLVDLDLAAARQTTVDRTVTFGPIRGRLPSGTTSAFAGFYAAGDGFGCYTVSYTT
ncbi:HtaA domain-containing protein [Conexibacter sp. CPCC 206217]|uniref:HtaA domain-containing protein n=1 Tax=Conexibacter sp. CPCC 206217 TaxID=3064574 RepID=UPI002725E162|nr:HtaA domain-containing protein [Conexibacter sp. CPCC 206217]MDO8210484.1 HtaA domain-containing protein [Conexibacter sp. CPCC 206217]